MLGFMGKSLQCSSCSYLQSAGVVCGGGGVVGGSHAVHLGGVLVLVRPRVRAVHPLTITVGNTQLTALRLQLAGFGSFNFHF